MNKLKTFDLGYFIFKSHFEEDGAQNYLVFQSMHRHFKTTNNKYISSSKGLSNENIKPYATSDNSLTALIDLYGSKVKVKFTRSSLKQPNKLTYDKEHRVHFYIVFYLSAFGSNDNDSTLKNCLFDAVTLTKNTDINKYKYFGYGIGFDRRSSFPFPGGGFGQNVLIFRADMNSSAHIDNKKKDILVLGKGATQGLEHTFTTEKMYSINFTVTNKKFRLSLHYNGANSYLFVNGTEIFKFKAKDLKF